MARAPLSLAELAAITGKSHREISERGIQPVVQFLIKLDGRLTFYHARFHEFVTGTLLYEDEVKKAHGAMARWLQRPENRNCRYRWSSMAHHLFAAGDCEALLRTVDEAFLLGKVARFGYAVLEDVELYTRCLLIKGDPSLIDRCVAMVERLREKVGGDLVTEVSSAVRPYRSGPPSFRSRILEPPVPAVEGLDVYVAVLPKGEISADFFEIVPVDEHLVVAIGDAPATGLESAFVARFIATLFRDLVLKSLNLPEVLAQINSRVSGYDYFRRVTMQCLNFDARRGVVQLANAGHPYPVHYSAKSGTCDVLPLLGDILGELAGSVLGDQRISVLWLKCSAGRCSGDDQ